MVEYINETCKIGYWFFKIFVDLFGDVQGSKTDFWDNPHFCQIILIKNYFIREFAIKISN